jgi:SAM-dependent methyltransferase
MNPSCPVCLSNTLVATRLGDTPLWRCTECGVHGTQNVGTNEQTNLFYSEHYVLHSSVAAQRERHRLFRMPEYHDMIGRIIRWNPSPQRWLDVGCDHGFLLDEVRRAGMAVVGVEPQRSARAYAQSVGLDVVPGLDDVAGTFDVVTAFHVLEHIATPRDFVQSCINRLADGGVFALRVPDFGSRWRTLFGSRWVWFQPKVHCLHFDESALQRLVRECGLEVVACERRAANTMLTRRSFWLAAHVFRQYRAVPMPSMRDVLARTYQDIVGREIMLIARKPMHNGQPSR